MNGICPLYDFNTYFKFIGLVSLIMILIITGLYYTYVYHCSILEKYETGNIKEDTISSNLGESGNRSTFPKNKYPGLKMQKPSISECNILTDQSKKAECIQRINNAVNNDKYNLRDCKVYFVKDEEKIKECDADTGDKKTCSYTFKGWQEFDTYTDNYGSNIVYPKKIYTKDYTNTDELVNSYFTSKCFKEFDFSGKGQSQSFEFKENDLVKFDSKGTARNTEVDTNIFNGLRYTSIQFLNSDKANDNFTRVIDSICDIKYSPIAKLVDKKFYKFEFDSNNNFSNITKVAINADQTAFTTIPPDNALEDFASFVSHGLCYDLTNKENKPFKIFIKPKITIKANIYTFNYVSYLCETTQIKNYTKVRAEINGSSMMSFNNMPSTTVNISLGSDINLDALDKNKYTSDMVDYKTDITDDLEIKIKDLTQIIIDNNKIAIAAEEAKIVAKDAEIIKGLDNQSNFGEKDNKRFTDIINLKKKDGVSRIFDYPQGTYNTQKSTINIPLDAKINYINGNEICMIFNNINNNQYTSTFNLSIPAGTTYVCDILIVGGGGGGGQFGGGGGAGRVLLGKSKNLTGYSTINVGNGGWGQWPYWYGNGNNGSPSSIVINNETITAEGGGGGGSRSWYNWNGRSWDWHGRTGNEGGSGGGGSHSNDGNTQGQGGGARVTRYNGWETYGNKGGVGKPGFRTGKQPDHSSGGGGGAGGDGWNYDPDTGGGNGGKGIDMSAYFGKNAGHNGYFGGGGGGNTYWGSGYKGYGNGGNNLYGGGGDGGFDGYTETSGVNGLANTGGGGGGGKWDDDWGNWWNIKGGNGGSGVVIIKIKNIYISSIPDSIVDNVYTNWPNYHMYMGPNILQNNFVAGFIFLQAGYYRFKVDISVDWIYKNNQWVNRDGSPSNNIYSELMIFDESNFDRSKSKYNGRKVFKHNIYNGQYKPSYLKQYIYIPKSKFYRIGYRCTTYNNTQWSMWLRYNMYSTYLKDTPIALENTIPSQLMAWYKFDGNSNDSTTNNYILKDNGGNKYSDDTNRKFINTKNGSLKATSIPLKERSFSISVWARYKNSNGGFFILQGTSHGTNLYLHIGARGKNAYCLAFYANDLEAGASRNPSEYPDDVNNWVHLVYVVEKNENLTYNRKIYRNGDLISADTSGTAFIGNGDLRIGNNVDVDISDFLIFNRAISKEDVESLYNTVLSSSTPAFTSTYVSLASPVDDNKNDDPNLFTTFNMAAINTNMEGYLFNGSTIFNHYKNKDKYFDIFKTINYENNNSKNYQALAVYLDTESSLDYTGRTTPIDFFKIAEFRTDRSKAVNKKKEIEDGLPAQILENNEIQRVDTLLKAINNIDYNVKLKIINPTRKGNSSITSIFGRDYANFFTYEKITNKDVVSNVIRPPLSTSIYIEALK